MAKNEFSLGTVAESIKNQLYQVEGQSGFQDAGQLTIFPIVERSTGILSSTALAYAASLGDLSSLGDLLSGLLKELNQLNNPGEPNCKITPVAVGNPNDPPDAEASDYIKLCLQKSSLFQAAKSASSVDAAEGDTTGQALEIISDIFNLISELNKPADPGECINPYFDQFFNLIPVQFILSKIIRDLLKDALASLTKQDVQTIIRDVKPCGSELEKIYTNSFDIPQITFPLFKLPSIPTIPTINLMTILNKLIIEAICIAICSALTPTIVYLSRRVNEFLKKFLTEENIGAGSYTEFLNNSLGKIDLNMEIGDQILKQAIIQGLVGNYYADLKELIGKPTQNKIKLGRDGLFREPTSAEENEVLDKTTLLIRKYFKAINEFISEPFDKKVYDPSIKKYATLKTTRDLGTKELIFLMLGEFNCFTIQDLVQIGSEEQFSKLGLNTEAKITRFFSFIGGSVDPIEIVSGLKAKACPPDPCEKIEQEVVDEVQAKMSNLCNILNVKKSGLPPIPVNKILSAVGLEDLFNSGIKEQFKQLKVEQLLYLGFPSLQNWPNVESLQSGFLPGENSILTDYELWTNKTIKDDQFFRKFFLRGGPPLNWDKYEKVNINKNLVGSTLEDNCGDNETFTETFIHIYNDIFKLNSKKIQNSLEEKKKVYTKSFEDAVNNQFNKRQEDKNK